MDRKRIAVLTSGGDAPGMNAAIRAVTRKGLYHGCEVIGVLRGYQGLIGGEFQRLGLNSVGGIISRGGTMLKTARSEDFKTPEGFGRALRNLEENDVDGLVVIGGDGSMAGARKLAEAGLPTLVIPATIDNDMAGTEYTLGFDTALNTIVDAVNKIRDTVSSHERVAVVEVMGRHSGNLAVQAGIACGAEVILIPEIPADLDAICDGLVKGKNRGKLHSIVLVAEGAGRAQDVADQIKARTSFAAPITVLGYIQRGGSPSATDNIVGSRMGAAAVDCVMSGEWNRLIAMRGGAVTPVPYEEAAGFRLTVDRSLYELAGILAM